MTGEKKMFTSFEPDGHTNDSITFGDNSQGKNGRCSSPPPMGSRTPPLLPLLLSTSAAKDDKGPRTASPSSYAPLPPARSRSSFLGTRSNRTEPHLLINLCCSGVKFKKSCEVGVFVRLTNAYCIIPAGGSQNFYIVLEAQLAGAIQVVRASIGGTRIVGRPCVGNKRGLLLPHTITDQEFQHLKNSMPNEEQLLHLHQQRMP